MAKRNNGEGTIRKRADGRWEGRYYDPLLQKQKSVYGKTQKEVIEKIKSVTRDIDDGIFVSKNQIHTLTWFDSWLSTYNTNVKPLTYDAYASIIKNHISPYLGHIPIQELQTEYIQNMYNSMLDESVGGLSVKTVRNVHGVVHKALEQAVNVQLIKRNPAEACVLPKHIKKEIEPMDSDTVRLFLSEIRHDEFAEIYIVTLFTGMRRGEVLGLKWECVDFDNGTIKVKRQIQKRKGRNKVYYLAPTKNGKERLLFPAKFIMDILYDVKLRQDNWKKIAKEKWNTDTTWNGLVFTTRLGKYLVPDTVYSHYKRIVEDIGQGELRFHDLRHSFAVISLENGDNVKLVQEALGHHSSAFTLDTYGHITNRATKESAERMQNYFGSISAS